MTKKKLAVGHDLRHTFEVTEADIAAFEGKVVHAVCATFVLAREAEWAGRLFVLELKGEEEEGIGTQLTIEHKAPAFVGEKVTIFAKLSSLVENNVTCSYEAKVGERLIATGTTGQKILPKVYIDQLFSKINGKN